VSSKKGLAVVFVWVETGLLAVAFRKSIRLQFKMRLKMWLMVQLMIIG
jgi:hypothetical protein